MRVALEKGVQVVSVNDPFIDLEYMVGSALHTLTPTLSFYRAMHYSAKRGLAIACRREEGHPACKKLAWLFVWVKVQVCIWST